MTVRGVIGSLTVLTAMAVAGTLYAGLYPEMRPPWVTWVEDGKPLATVVAQPPEEGTSPARELNIWLKRITGVQLPVAERSEPAKAAAPTVILGGPAAWNRLGLTPESLQLGGEGFVIRSLGNDLVIAGQTQLGTLFGVYAFLERYLGCRWFWPGELGMVAPQQTTLRVGRIDEVSRPDFRIRWIIGDPDCARFNRLNVGLREPGDFRVQGFVHTYLRLVPPKYYWKDHPEFYAQRGGKRVDPTGPRAQINLCTTNPAVVAAAVRQIDQIMAADPSIDMISVDPMDSQRFCQCGRCRALQDPQAPYEARASRLVFDFTNRVAEQVAARHPRLLIKTIAYHTYLAPPPTAMGDNVVIQFCRFTCHNHYLGDGNCPESSYFNKHLLAWRKVCRRIMLYEYYMKASWCGLPWPIVHTLRRDLPYLRQNEVVGIASQWNRNDANNGLAYYVAAKMLWDSNIDVDALLADFYAKAYAEAAAPMRRYHEGLENALEQSGLHVAMQMPHRAMWQFFTPELEAELAADLAAARQMVRDPQAARRVDLIARGFRYAQLVAAYLRVIAQRVEHLPRRPRASLDSAALEALEAACGPQLNALRQFLHAEESLSLRKNQNLNAGAMAGGNNYINILLSPRLVAGHWHGAGDRPPLRPAPP